MANKKVNQLTSKPAVNLTDLFLIADPTSGQAFKTTISDLGTAIGSGVSSVNSLVGAVVLDTDDIQELVSPTNKWFTDTRARAALSASSPLAYNSGTGVFSIPAATSSQNGYLTSTDWSTFNSKQAALSGTGFVKISGTTISYDNSTYLTTSDAASSYVSLTGNQTILGIKTFSSMPILNAGSGVDGQIIFADATNKLKTVGNFKYNDSTGVLTTQIGPLGSNAYTSTAYLPLAGGTLTGALSGTSASLSSSITASALYVTGMTAGSGAIYFSAGVNRLTLANYNTNGIIHFEVNGGTPALVLNANLSASFQAGGSFAGALSGTSASFSSTITAQSTGGSGLRVYGGSGTNQWDVYLNSTNLRFSDNTGTGSVVFDRPLSGTSATFSSSVTAGSANFTLNSSSTSSNPVLTLSNNDTTNNNWNDINFSTATTGGNEVIGKLRFKQEGHTYPYVYSTFVVQTINDLTGGLGDRLTIDRNGATTFSSSVTANGTMQLANDGTYGSNYKMLAFTGNSNGSHRIFAASNDDMFFAAQTGKGFEFRANGGTTPTVRIDQGGNVGIGTGSPSYKLQVNGASGTIARITDGTNNLDFYAGSSLNEISATTTLLLSTANTERMRITSGGALQLNGASNVATIQTNSDSNVLAIVSSSSLADAKPRIELCGTSQATSANTAFYRAGTHICPSATAATEYRRITSGGNVRINTTSDINGRGAYLTVNAGETMQLYGYGNGSGIGLFMCPNSSASGSHTAIAFRSPANGNVGSIVTDNTTTTYNTTSDYRLKEDLKPIKGLEIINKINVYDFKWRNENNRMDGVMAHELAEILPYAVTGVKDGEEMQGVDYSKIVPVMVQAIKELKAELDTLKNK